MLRTWRNFLRLPASQQWVALESLGLLLLAGAGLRALGFRRMVRRIHGCPLLRQHGALAPRDYERLLGAVVRHALPRSRCLLRSVSLFWLLRRHGVASDLRIGVRKQDGRLDAHAWVECDGTVLNDSDDVGRRFTAFGDAVLPSAAEWV